MFTVIWGVNVINFLLKVSWLCWLNRRFCLSKTGQERCFVSPLTQTFVSLRHFLANQPSTEKRPEPAKNSRTNTNKAAVLRFCCTLGSNMFNIFFMFLFCYLLIPQHYYKLNFLSTWATKSSCFGKRQSRVAQDFAMSEFSLILLLQKKQENPTIDMAEIQIKSERLTPFGGIFSIMEQFDSTLSSVIDSTPGLRCRSFH